MINKKIFKFEQKKKEKRGAPERERERERKEEQNKLNQKTFIDKERTMYWFSV